MLQFLDEEEEKFGLKIKKVSQNQMCIQILYSVIQQKINMTYIVPFLTFFFYRPFHLSD